MVSPTFLSQYSSQGDQFLQSQEFKSTFYTSFVQAKYDRQYFYGILWSVMQAGGAGRKHVLRYQGSQDGFLTWRDMLKDCENDGSTMLRIEKLKSILNQSYSRKYPGGLAAYIERLQTTIEELSTLKSPYTDEDIKMEVLVSGLRKDGNCAYYLDYIQDTQLDFATACGYLHE